MTQTAKAQEPSMEEILASIRRIIADDDAKPAKGTAMAPETAPPAKQPAAPATPPAPPAKPAAPPAPKSATLPATPAAAANSQDEIDAMLAELDGPPKATSKPAASPEAPDVLDLTEAMTSQATPPPGPAPSFRTIDANPDVVFANKPQPAPVPDRGLISTETVKAVDSAFNTLAHTVIGQNARTLEDLVREMLRPMLKSWLDDNLPGVVERIVRAEIERVSRGRP